MFSTTFKRPLVTLAVVIGLLLAAAGPASAAGIEGPTPRTYVTVFDAELNPVVTDSRAAPIGSTTDPSSTAASSMSLLTAAGPASQLTNSFVVDGPFSLKATVGACDVNVRLHPDDTDADMRVRRSADGTLVLAGRIAVPPHTTQVELENTLVTSIAAADPQVCMVGT